MLLFGEHQVSSQLRYESNDVHLQIGRELCPDLCWRNTLSGRWEVRSHDESLLQDADVRS
jgi:hypothetical protein